MDRRTFVATIAGSLAGRAGRAPAQVVEGSRRIALLNAGTIAAAVPSSFFEGLAKGGWIAGELIT